MPAFAQSTPITANGIYTLGMVADGKKHYIRTSDTTNGATVKLEYVDINSNNVEYDSTNTTWADTTGGATFVGLKPAGSPMQLNVTGAGASTNIAVTISQLG